MNRLRHIAAFVMLAVSFAAIALWWRSCQVGDLITAPATQRYSVTGASFQGQLVLCWLPFDSPPDWQWSYYPLNEFMRYVSPELIGQATFWGFRLTSDSSDINLALPYWFPVLLAAAAALSVRPPPRFRFSSRELLAAVTLAAGTFGVVLSTMPRG